MRAGGLPASVHSSAGGRRGLPRWRVRGSGVADDGVRSSGPGSADGRGVKQRVRNDGSRRARR